MSLRFSASLSILEKVLVNVASSASGEGENDKTAQSWLLDATVLVGFGQHSL